MTQQPYAAATVPVPAGPVPARYRFIVADDDQLWPSASGPGGLLGVPEADQLDGFDRLTDGGCALVVVCGPRQAAGVRRASALARSRSQARVAVVPLALGPVGQDVVVAMAQSLLASAPGRPVAELVAFLPTMAASILDLALVSSVAKVDQASVALRHHLMSYLPGRRLFAVQISPTAAVARVTGKGTLTPAASPLHRPDFDDTYGVALTVVGNRPVPDAVLSYCRSSVAPTPQPGARRLADYWGDQQATEVVSAPADATGWVLDLLPRLDVRPCSWCDEPLPVVSESCVFCGHVVR